jgi:exopolyphosphatase/guanosine-5'-triphosphate,3'-diphosphate pyrophosphatase
MIQRYAADMANSDMVGTYARHLCAQTAGAWNLDEDDIDLLSWSARLHEIGIAISQKHYNRHSAYLIENSDMPGFSQGDQIFISRLLRGHRGKLPSYLLDDIPRGKQQKLARMLVLLRLAVTLKHADAPSARPGFSAQAKGDRLKVSFSDRWRESHPLTIWEVAESLSVFEKLGIAVEMPKNAE